MPQIKFIKDWKTYNKGEIICPGYAFSEILIKNKVAVLVPELTPVGVAVVAGKQPPPPINRGTRAKVKKKSKRRK